MGNARLSNISEMCTQATKQAEFARTTAKNHPTCVKRANSLGYKEGMASAFNKSHIEMKAELRRLYFKFANGSLTAEDFGVDP